MGEPIYLVSGNRQNLPLNTFFNNQITHNTLLHSDYPAMLQCFQNNPVSHQWLSLVVFWVLKGLTAIKWHVLHVPDAATDNNVPLADCHFNWPNNCNHTQMLAQRLSMKINCAFSIPRPIWTQYGTWTAQFHIFNIHRLNSSNIYLVKSFFLVQQYARKA